MKAIFSSKSYWIISILATVIIFAAMFDFGKTYKSETAILISPKNPTAEKNINQIVENARQISKTLLFYDELLRSSSEIKDPVNDKISSERKNYWDSLVETKSLSGSGVIQLAILNDSQNKAEKLSHAASLTLVQELSKYYNIRTEIDAKIIDGPITSQSKKYNYGILLAASLIIALLSVYLSYAISDLIREKIAEKRLIKKFRQKREMFSNELNPEKAKEKLRRLLEGRI